MGASIRTKQKCSVCMSTGHDGIVRATIHVPDGGNLEEWIR
jgi:hypothetical protein